MPSFFIDTAYPTNKCIEISNKMAVVCFYGTFNTQLWHAKTKSFDFLFYCKKKITRWKKNRYWMFLKIKYKQKYGILQSFFNGGQFIRCENNEYCLQILHNIELVENKCIEKIFWYLQQRNKLKKNIILMTSIESYKLNIKYLKNHFQKLWTEY